MTAHYIVENNPIGYFYRIVFLSNNYRDPLLRKFKKDYDLTRPEFSILISLGFQECISAIEISDITRQPQNTISRGVFLLSQKKLIKKENDKQDKRIYQLYLTDKGRKVQKQLMTYLFQTDANMVACLTSREKDQLAKLLSKMCAAAPKSPN